MTTQGSSRVIGVRLPDSPALRFFTTDLDGIPAGSWVIVPIDQGEGAAQVIVTPDQMVMADLSETPPSIVGVFSGDEVERTEIPGETVSGEPPEGRLVGGVGYRDPARRGISNEDTRYRHAKQRLPRLGQRLATPKGASTVVSRQVFGETVTLRYDETGQQETLPAGDIPDSGFTQSED